MGRGAVGPPSGYSRQVATNIERLRLESGWSVARLTSEAGISRSYYQSRVRLESPFNTNDLESIANVLGVMPHDLANPDETTDPVVRAESDVVGARLRLLMGTDRDSKEQVLELSRISTVDFDALIYGSGQTVPIRESSLARIAERFGIDTGYLTSPHDAEIKEQVEAELELRAAMHAVGAKSIQMRVVGETEPAALRAIAQSLREIRDD